MEVVKYVSLDLLDNIRDLINERPKKQHLMENLINWHKLTSALDSIEDSTMAVRHYCESCFPDGNDGKYLYIYGLLQALFLQQDAINALSIVLLGKKVNWDTEFDDAYYVRELRNDLGHPTQRKHDTEFVFLTQATLSKWWLSFIKGKADNSTFEFFDVDVKKSICDNSEAINSILSSIYEHLKIEYKSYLEAHHVRKVVDIFDGLDSCFDSMSSDSSIDPKEYDTAKKILSEFEDELLLRYETKSAIESYNETINEAHTLFDILDEMMFDLADKRSQFDLKEIINVLYERLKEIRNFGAEIDAIFEEDLLSLTDDRIQKRECAISIEVVVCHKQFMK